MFVSPNQGTGHGTQACRKEAVVEGGTASDDSSFVTGIELFVDGGMAQI